MAYHNAEDKKLPSDVLSELSMAALPLPSRQPVLLYRRGATAATYFFAVTARRSSG
jgi:hypothetical protein